MRDRCVELLAPSISSSEKPVVVDATLGLGGHSEALLSRFENLTVIGIDRDQSALEKAAVRLTPFGNRFKTAHCVFDQITEVVQSFGYSHINGALFDLGVSSMQLDERERGFSYSQDAPLDMRMDRSTGITAYEIVNTYLGEQELGVGADGGLPCRQVGLRHKAGLHTEFGEVGADELDGRAEHGTRAQHVVTGLEHAQAQHENRRHARSRADASLSAFERGQALLEAGDRGVAVAAVGVTVFFAREAARRGLGRGLHVAAGQVQGFGVFAIRAARHGLAHGQGVAVPSGIVVVHARDLLQK